jgi:hypothetical protein
MTDKERLRKLIDELPETAAGELLDFAEFLRQKSARRVYDAALARLNVTPPDAEPYSEADAEESRLAREEYGRDGSVSLDTLRAELGL